MALDDEDEDESLAFLSILFVLLLLWFLWLLLLESFPSRVPSGVFRPLLLPLDPDETGEEAWAFEFDECEGECFLEGRGELLQRGLLLMLLLLLLAILALFMPFLAASTEGVMVLGVDERWSTDKLVCVLLSDLLEDLW